MNGSANTPASATYRKAFSSAIGGIVAWAAHAASLGRVFILEELFLFPEFPYIMVRTEQIPDRQDPGVERMILVLVLVHAGTADHTKIPERLEIRAETCEALPESKVMRRVRIRMADHEGIHEFLFRHEPERAHLREHRRDDIRIAFLPEPVPCEAIELDPYRRSIRVFQHVRTEGSVVADARDAEFGRLDVEPRVREQVLAVHYHIDRDVGAEPHRFREGKHVLRDGRLE